MITAGSRRRTARHLAWLSRLAQKSRLQRFVATVSLWQLEDSSRPLLFSRLPRMLRRDGGTPRSLQRLFGYLDHGSGSAPDTVVSSQRWSRALATSRRLAARRSTGRKP